MKLNVKVLAANAVIAALYAALTYFIAPLAYGEIQFRISEIMIFLAFYNRKYIPGLILGCFIANLFSPMLVYDITFGTAATAIVVICISLIHRLFKNRTIPALALSALIGAVVNGLLVGLELKLAYQSPFVLSAIYVAAGELGVLIIGAVAFYFLQKNRFVLSILDGSLLETGRSAVNRG